VALFAAFALAGAPRSLHAQQIRTEADTVGGSGARDTLESGRAASPDPGRPFAGWLISPDSIDRAPLGSVPELLQARIPGLTVQRISGASGSASRIRLRGARSATSSSSPLVIVDGIRFDVAAPGFFALAGCAHCPYTQWLSRLDELNPDDIEKIEILSGAAGAARYGPGAGNGVILVTTRRGAPHELRWRAHGSLGAASQATDFPANFKQRGIRTSDGGHTSQCSLYWQSMHYCTPMADSLLVGNTLEEHSPFRVGISSQLGLSGSGGSDRATFFVSGNFTRENGTLDVNQSQRHHLAANATLRLLPTVDVSVHAGYSGGAFSGIAPDDSNGYMYSGLAASPELEGGYRITPDTIRMRTPHRSTKRSIIGASVTWNPSSWMAVEGTLGEDRDRWIEDRSFHSIYDVREHKRSDLDARLRTARAEVTTTFPLAPNLDAQTTVGIERVKYRYHERALDFWTDPYPFHNPLVADAVLEHHLNSVFGGLDLSWKQRVWLTSGIRRGRDTNGPPAQIFGSFGAAWDISDEPWFPENRIASELRLHVRYGEATQSTDVSLPTHPALYEVDRLPTARESEAGLSATILGGRASISMAYYSGRSSTRFHYRNFTSFPVADPNHEFAVRNHGFEGAIATTLIGGSDFRLELDATASFPRTTFEGPSVYSGRGVFGQRLVAGYPLAGYWGAPIVGFEDRNGDGMITSAGCSVAGYPSSPDCEIELGGDRFLGSSAPTRELSLRPRLVHGRVTLSAHFDYRGGNKLFDYTRYARCGLVLCRASQDASSSLTDQARLAAANLNSFAGYIEDGSFWKFRELAFSVAASEGWARKLGARELAIAVAARNLATWTGYSGLDPEVSSAGFESLDSVDNFTQPATREVRLRVDMGW
jgi:TonB-dependent SusC/RagA subfamily outer membrane receptor